MKAIASCAVLAALVLLSNATWAERTANEPPLQLGIVLVDGSRVVGTPSVTSLSVTTSFAKMDIPWSAIRELKFTEDRSAASIALKNGDVLKGVPSLRMLELQTAFGRIAVDPRQIVTVGVGAAGAAAIPLEGLLLHYSFNAAEDNTVSDTRI
jgi:hypothetical protein